MCFAKRVFAQVVLVVLATPAFAHPGHDTDFAAISGFTHPFRGLDHLLAMVAVGLWAIGLGGRALLVLPAVFVSAMVFGALTAHLGLLPSAPGSVVEAMIAASVSLLGLAIAFRVKLAAASAAVVVAAVAVAHGFAHGAEMPAGAAIGSYLAGMACATGLLHGLGIMAGMSMSRWPWATRLAGVVISWTGLILAFA